MISLLLLTAATALAQERLPGPFDDGPASYSRVTNGGFESVASTGHPTSWTGVAQFSHFAVDDSFAYKGSASAAMVDRNWVNSGAGAAYAQSINVSNGSWYVISAYIYSGMNGASNVYIDLADQSYPQQNGGNGDCTIAATRNKEEWEFVWCVFQANRGNITVRTVVDGSVERFSYAAFDEVALTPLNQFEPPFSLSTDYDGDGYTAQSGDCDEDNASINPGASEVWYDGVDQACDGGNDFDQDGDGVSRGTDCDDTDASVNPSATEVWYDGVDQDCDGNDDDQDGDGVSKGNDCDDTDATINPSATEVWYDGVDQDCDGGSDFDQDGDAFLLDDDCDDTDASVNPSATEVWYDGVDQDCDGGSDFDQDRDGFLLDDDCDDTDPAVNPSATEVWYDGTDQDCDGNDNDQDGDGFILIEDCDDEDPAINPLAFEIPDDGIDQDCDGADATEVDTDPPDTDTDPPDTDPPDTDTDPPDTDTDPPDTGVTDSGDTGDTGDSGVFDSALPSASDRDVTRQGGSGATGPDGCGCSSSSGGGLWLGGLVLLMMRRRRQ